MSFQSNTVLFIGLYVIAVFSSSLKVQDWLNGEEAVEMPK